MSNVKTEGALDAFLYKHAQISTILGRISEKHEVTMTYPLRM